MRLIGILLATLCHATFAAAGADAPADVARYLAGLPVAATGSLRDLSAGEAWQEHSRKLRESWSGFDRRQLSKVRTFAKNQLVDRRHAALYFFSGPDFAYAQALFPDASTYVLAGLEPADTFPAADAAKLGGLTLSRVRTSFETFFDFWLVRDRQYARLAFRRRAGALCGPAGAYRKHDRRCRLRGGRCRRPRNKLLSGGGRGPRYTVYVS